MRRRHVTTPRPLGLGLLERLDDPARRSTSSSVGANTPVAGLELAGWIRVLPSKPICRPWTHSASKPSGVLDVVVDAVEDHLAGGPGGEQGTGPDR
jgi:hypothetical protein